MLFKWITIISILITAVSASPLWLRNALPPKDDPFYKPAAGFENEKPGTILRSRALPSNALAAFSIFPQNINGVHQFLYRTTDGLGKATATVTTLMVPFNADPSKLVSYQTHEDSPTTDCAPSYALQKGTGLKGFFPQSEVFLMDTLLARGYYVNVPDYDGPGSFFTAGRNSGNGVLDSIRAVLASGEQTKLQADAKVQLWGYSGGAMAAGWAAQLHASYAPELKIIGVALGGTPVSINATFNAVNKSSASGMILACMHGLSGQYPELAAYIDTVLKPEKKQAFMDAKKLCFAEYKLKYGYQDIGDYFNRPDYSNEPIFTKALEASTMGKLGAPRIPLLIYHAYHDDTVPYSLTENMYNSWCASGGSDISIEFVRDDLSNHVVLAVTGSANAIKYLVDGFNNGVRVSGCSKRTTFTSALDPGAAEVFGEEIWDGLNGILLGRRIGSNDIF